MNNQILIALKNKLAEIYAYGNVDVETTKQELNVSVENKQYKII